VRVAKISNSNARRSFLPSTHVKTNVRISHVNVEDEVVMGRRRLLTSGTFLTERSSLEVPTYHWRLTFKSVNLFEAAN
jgi:hypothetical protein